MPAITRPAFLVWANDHTELLLHVSTRVALLESADALLARWRQVRDLGDSLSPYLEDLCKLSTQSLSVDEAQLEQQILAQVNAPISTAAKVERPVRDDAWLAKIHDAGNWLVIMLDEALVVGQPIATRPPYPAPEDPERPTE